MALPRPLPFGVKGKVYLSPMAGLTDLPYRQIAKSYGADVMLTEFTAARAILMRIPVQEQRIEFTEEERPLGVQIFGAVPEEMARAARRVQEMHAPEFIDINFGCPAKKITEKNGGSGCLRDPELLSEITSAVYGAISIPVTAKIRIGWDQSTGVEGTLEIAHRLEQAGISALAIHGRTRAQKYRGVADWDRIRRVKEAVGIPVIGNGDVFGPVEAKRMLDETGVDAVMIGRGAVGNPWVFRRVKHYLATGEMLPGPTPEERVRVVLRHMAIAIERSRSEEIRVIREMRRHFSAYTKGMPGAARLRGALVRLESAADVEGALRQFVAAQTSGAAA